MRSPAKLAKMPDSPRYSPINKVKKPQPRDILYSHLRTPVWTPINRPNVTKQSRENNSSDEASTLLKNSSRQAKLNKQRDILDSICTGMNRVHIDYTAPATYSILEQIAESEAEQ